MIFLLVVFLCRILAYTPFNFASVKQKKSLMNKTVQRILGAVNVPMDTSTISKVAWETGMHTGEAVGQKASDIIDDIVDFIFGEQ